VVLNIWFWITPIVWDQAIMPEEYNWIFSWNPMFYIVEGYRGALIYPEFISPDFSQALFFWGVTFILLGIGSYVFRRLKPEFADVL
jgi:lipopolysaccharide transport system permease protein/teichoic acid transport system permease protein